MPTGFSSVEAADEVAKRLQQAGDDANELPVVATGYGRIAVPYANKVVTEITCHARGACGAVWQKMEPLWTWAVRIRRLLALPPARYASS